MTTNYLAWLLLHRRAGAAALAHAINHATPEQCAEAMTKCTPEAEEFGRRFEDAGE